MTETVIVTVKEGKVRGIKTKSQFSGKEFYSFYGIPYGEAPMNSLRFKDPVKVKPWKSIRDATTENSKECTQYAYYSLEIQGSEDCLYNNIYTSQLPSEGTPLKPVIFCIHHGGFRFGSPATSDYGSPDFVMHHDVVYVCVAFRLHILGFLNLNMKECSGNQGLKDIILSLKWVKDNIRKFNGDPNNITLIGTSSGSATVHLLMMSPAAKGLFHKAVLSSPTYAFLVYGEYQDENETTAFRLGRMLGFEGNDRKRLLSFLREKPAEELVEAQRDYEKLYEKTIVPVLPQSNFLPTIDAASATPVIPISPRKLINSVTPIPTIFGICQRESVMGFSTEKQLTLTEKNYRIGYRQNQWCWMHDLNDDEMKLLNDQVERFYLKDCTFEDAPLSVKVDMLTEIAFHDIYDTIINPIAEKLPSSVYLYKFCLDSKMSRLKNVISLVIPEKIPGSYHTCDYACWSRDDYLSQSKNVKMIKTYTKFITTFAKNGDPNNEEVAVQWRPSTKDKPCYLRMDEELKMVDGEYFSESVDFWKNIKKQFKKN